MHGRHAGNQPPEIAEFFLALEFGWTPHYIRSLSPRDMRVFTLLLSTKNRIEAHMAKMAQKFNGKVTL